MVIKKENLKETEIVLSFDYKTIDLDIQKVLDDISKIKSKPFHDVFLFLTKEFPKEYLYKILKNLKYKDLIEKEKQILIKI